MSCYDSTYINPEMLLKNPAFTQVIRTRAEELIFISGQVALNERGELMETAFNEQLIRCLDNVKLALDAAGSKWKDVVLLRMYVVDLKPEHRFIIRMAMKDIFGSEAPPTNTLVGIQNLARKELRVEIEAMAVSN